MQVKVGWINGDYEEEGKRLKDEKSGVVKVEGEIELGTGRERERECWWVGVWGVPGEGGGGGGG